MCDSPRRFGGTVCPVPALCRAMGEASPFHNKVLKFYCCTITLQPSYSDCNDAVFQIDCVRHCCKCCNNSSIQYRLELLNYTIRKAAHPGTGCHQFPPYICCFCWLQCSDLHLYVISDTVHGRVLVWTAFPAALLSSAEQ